MIQRAEESGLTYCVVLYPCFISNDYRDKEYSGIEDWRVEILIDRDG